MPGKSRWVNCDCSAVRAQHGTDRPTEREGLDGERLMAAIHLPMAPPRDTSRAFMVERPLQPGQVFHVATEESAEQMTPR